MRCIKIFVLFLVLFLIFVSSALAEIQVAEKDCLPVTINGGQYWMERAETEWELASVEAVAYEVYHLQSVLPVLKEKDWPVYVVRKRCLFPSGEIAGCAVPGAAFVFASKANKGYIFVTQEREEWVRVPPDEEHVKRVLRMRRAPVTPENVREVRENEFWLWRWETRRVKVARTVSAAPYLSAYVAAHEIGHLVRFGFLSESDVREYLKLRGLEGAERKSRFDDPEELFAEDFRWLFGTEKANQVEYRPSCPEPGEKEKAWILERLGIERLGISG